MLSPVCTLPPPCTQINAEKSPFLTDKLKVFMLPTLALIKHEKVEDYVVGFAVRQRGFIVVEGCLVGCVVMHQWYL